MFVRIRLLGTGTPSPSLARMGSSYLVEIGSDLILFDFGPGAYHRLMEAGIKATQISHLFLTHLHYDHCCDYPRLLLTRWDQGAGRIPELRVFGPPPLTHMTEQLFGNDGAFGPDINARIKHKASIDVFRTRGGISSRKWPMPQVIELHDGSVTTGDGWTIIAVDVEHVQPYLNCYGYRLDSEKGSIVYSGDTGPCQAIRKLAENCDVLIHMCHYISGRELSSEYKKACAGHLDVAKLASDANVKNLVLSHITEQMDIPSIRERMIEEISEIFDGTLYFGYDLMEIS
jgi:ribonuclease BN (tRNA processing enzyme)